MKLKSVKTCKNEPNKCKFHKKLVLKICNMYLCE